MRRKKLLSWVLAVAMLAAAATGAVTVLADAQVEEPAEAYYISVTGTVVSIMSWTPTADSEDTGGTEIIIETSDYEDARAHLIITDRTVFPFDGISDIEAGDTVTGFVPAKAPMIMIYPPQYTIHVLIAGVPEDQNVQVDRFSVTDNENFPFLSQSETFAFAIDEDTVVVTADGDEYEGDLYVELDGRRLVVIYGPSTRSIPEFATAIKVIALFEDAVPLDPGNGQDIDLDVTDMSIVVDGEEITAPSAFIADDGVTVMVPLRAIAEALGFEVTWINEDRAVELYGMRGVAEISARLVIGNTAVSQTFARRAPITIELPVAPLITNNTTYVPLVRFFEDVLEVSNAFVFEGRIEILTEGESME